MIDIRHIRVRKTARYAILRPNTLPNSVLFAIHGYREMVPYFIKKFQSLADQGVMVIEPQKILPPILIEGDPMSKRDQNQRFFDDFEETNGDKLILYPNPAKDVVTIEFELPEKIEQGTIKVYSAEGKQLMSTVVFVGSNRVSMDISELKGGLYIYMLTSNGEFVARRRLVIAK